MKKFSKWKNLNYKLESKFINSIFISNCVQQFWNEIISKLDKKDRIAIQLKLQDSISNSYKTISSVQVIANDSLLLPKIKEICISEWQEYNDYYRSFNVDYLIISYKELTLIKEEVKTTNNLQTNIRIRTKKDLLKKNRFHFIGKTKLPSTLDLRKWGNIIEEDSTNNVTIIKPFSSEGHNDQSELYFIHKFSNRYEVEFKIEPFTKYKFVDYFEDNINNPLNFTRVINNRSTYVYRGGQCVLKKLIRKTKFMTTVNQDAVRNSRYITLDIETKKNEYGIMIPYCICMCIPTKIINNNYAKSPLQKVSFYLSDYKNPEEMMEKAITFLMQSKYHKYKIYVHNFSHFDGIFLLSKITSLSNKVLPIFRNGKILVLKVHYGMGDKHYISFLDSFLILPSSLKKLASQFGVEQQKTIFPYLFANKVELNYKGECPKYEYFNTSEVTLEEYQLYKKQLIDGIWDLRKETIKYCIEDCIALHQIIFEFGVEILNIFQFDISRTPTLPSLALSIYRSNFLDCRNMKIPLIIGQTYSDLVSGYLGGHVDVYYPITSSNSKVYHYDVNSLYPFVMKNFPMPTGNPTFFEGDIRQIEPKAFGFFYVKITAPKTIEAPILMTKHKNISISPTGSWKGMYFSEELYNAEKYGYQFEVEYGYTFEKNDLIFKNYIDHLYTLKQNSSPKDSKYTISKLLMNSLYGRFGMSPFMEKHKVIHYHEHDEYLNKNIREIIDLNNGKEIISFLDDTKTNLNISICIAMAITSYAIIHMSQFLNLPGYKVYYTDTDSVFLDKPLPDYMISNELGKMKLEGIYDEAIFIAPKVYGVKSENINYTKVKGLKNKITYNDLSTLLLKNQTLEIPQEKWYRSISNSRITIINELYTLMKTETKRKIVYSSDGIAKSTEPFYIDDE